MEYTGRMVCDGNGNLLADEGERAGDPIAYDPDTDGFRFLAIGEPSHNSQFHKQYAGVVGTQDVDPELPGYAGPDAKHATEGNEHHWEENLGEPAEKLPDNVSRLLGGHTHQHKVGV